MTLDLETSRLQLLRVQPEDWEAYYPIFSAPETSQFSDLPRRPTEKRTRGFVNWIVRISQQSKGFGWMVRDRGSGTLLGCIRLNSIDKQASAAAIGYEFGELYWGKGYATEALAAVTKHCHGAMRLYRLEARTVEGNPASDRVLAKAGYRHEGTQRKKMVIGKQRFDLRLFGRLADD
ncbi:GNAT family N-acetyltransferase [Phyllobacterium phragmitis]|uniref:GNAT family protein n=1 Tax=Phyllobacterium phragmitis TaxID=2670329 RepID=A0ABQ0GXY5_9HYPH